jgi:predicted esterase
MEAVDRRLMLECLHFGSPVPDLCPVLFLHDGEGRPGDLSDIAKALAPRFIVVPRAPRWASLRGVGLYNWFTSPGPGLFDPVGMGDALSQLELLLMSFTKSAAGAPTRRLAAVGFGQGATILAVLAALWPERFDGLFLVGGFWPHLPTELLPERPMPGLRVRVLPGADGQVIEPARLAARRALVDFAEKDSAPLASCIGKWLSGVECREEVHV